MIISRTPFRVSFAGGGSDLPSFYRQEQGAVLSTSIDKYIYIAVHPFFDPNKTQLKYSKTELVDSVDDIKHPIIRECLRMLGIAGGIDINSIADIPAGTGLGSSSSFTVGLLKALNAYANRYVSPEYLGANACRIEIDLLKEPIGRQDQYAAAFGGLNFIEFNADDTVEVERIVMDPQAKRQLDRNLIMVYTGDTRSASAILEHQSAAMAQTDKRTAQREMVRQAYELKEILQNNQIDDFGRVLHEGWLLKKSLTSGISNSAVDELYEKGLKAGALGGKLLGAGGGGFVLFYCPEEHQPEFRKQMSGFRELNFTFDTTGSKITHLAD